MTTLLSSGRYLSGSAARAGRAARAATPTNRARTRRRNVNMLGDLRTCAGARPVGERRGTTGGPRARRGEVGIDPTPLLRARRPAVTAELRKRTGRRK